MPIDPLILLGVNPPTPVASPLQLQEQQLKLEEGRALRDQRIEAAKQRAKALKDDQDLQDAIKSNLGLDGLPDFDKAITTLYAKNPDAAQKLSTGITAARKASLETSKLQDEHKTAMITSAGQMLSGANEENWAIRYPVLKATNPEVAAMFSPQWDPTTPQKITTFNDAATSRKDYLENQDKALKHLLDGDEDKYLGQKLLAEPNLTPDRAAEIFREERDRNGITSSTIAGYANQPTVAAMLQRARSTVLGQKEVETLAGQAETRAQTKTNEEALRAAQARQQALEIQWHATTDANQKARINLERQRVGLEATRLAQATAAAQGLDLKPGTAAYRQAQDLADGTLTFQDFQRLHSRAQADAPLRAAIYDTARTLNPNFNPAAFEIGYKYASNPKVKSQIASIKNVESGVDDLLRASDAATRSGSPFLNQYAVKPIAIGVGSKKYSNFKTAVTAFADELSGALGYGSATDMSREMGFDMTDLNQSPANFKSNIQDIVVPFVARKKASILGQMGPYATTADSGAAKTVTAAQIQAVAKKNGTTVEAETARAKAEGYTVK